MKLNHFTDNTPKIVGSYNPSEHWSDYTHFAVMNPRTKELVASCGYFMCLSQSEYWGVEHYMQAAVSIEQAQLYAAAPAMFEMLSEIANGAAVDTERIKSLLSGVVDISESAARLLGDDAMVVINHGLASKAA